MRYITTILTFLLATIASMESVVAQSIRLGEQIPDLHITMAEEGEVVNTDKEFTCLIFIHSESEPCLNALSLFAETAEKIAPQSTIVLVTNEEADNYDELRQRLTTDRYTIAFDHNNRTFKAFGIRYVPFAVLYRTKNSRIEWFGPIHQLNQPTLTKISKR